MERPLIEQIKDLARYAPPSHVGTQNIRLVDGDFCGTFEMVRGLVQPGGQAEPHYHEKAYQVFYVIAGRAEVTLGQNAPAMCGPGTIVRIPPRLMHRVVAAGPEPLEVLIVYSPPLPERNAFLTATQ
jgi:mannose-6-phosphate isomerase-like protein (cupin superfamily)